jgi:hypothetical protein
MKKCLLWIVVVVMALHTSLSHAFAPVVLPVLIHVARGLVLSSATRQVLVSLGVAANDASWIVRTSSLVSRAANMLRIVDTAGVTYEVPMLPDEPIPAPEPEPEESEYDGTVEHPYPWNYPGVGVRNIDSALCAVPDWVSTDDEDHFLEDSYPSVQEFVDACTYNMQHSTEYPLPVYTGTYTKLLDEVISNTENTYFINFILCEVGDLVHPYNGYIYECYYSSRGGGSFEFYYSGGGGGEESPDGIKRFLRVGMGYVPDETVPDWTEEEKALFGEGGGGGGGGGGQVLRFVGDDGSVITIAGSQSGTVIQSLKQENNDVIMREVHFDQNALADKAAEQLMVNQVVSVVESSNSAGKAVDVDTILYSSSSTVVNTDPVSVDFPDDYARRGEAAAAAETIVEALKGEEISEILIPGAEVELPDFNYPKDMIDDGLPTPGLDWESFLPKLTPGDVVECVPLKFVGRTMVRPVTGTRLLEADEGLDLCPTFVVIRNILGWFFSVVSMIYIFRKFVRLR